MTNENADHYDARRRRVLLCAEAVSLAQVSRLAELAKALDPVRYEVHFASDPRYNYLFSDLPKNISQIYSIPSQDFLDALAKGSPMYSPSTLKQYVLEELELIQKIKPDVVIGAFRLSLAVSCAKSHVPYLNIVNAYWSPYSEVRFDIPEHALARGLGVPIARSLFRLAHPFIFARHAVPMNRVRRSFGLPSLAWDMRHAYTEADRVLYADLPELAPTHNRPSHHHYVGPVIWSPSIPLPAWWNSLPQDKPIIFATPGCSGEKDMLPIVLKALADCDVHIVAATAGRVSLNGTQANAHISDFLPGTTAAERSSIVICNGGSPATHQALAVGRPVLGIPSNLDQYLNMHGVVRAGAGILLRAGTLSAQAIRQAVRDLLDNPAFARSAARLGRSIQQYDMGGLVSKAIDGVLKA